MRLSDSAETWGHSDAVSNMGTLWLRIKRGHYDWGGITGGHCVLCFIIPHFLVCTFPVCFPVSVVSEFHAVQEWIWIFHMILCPFDFAHNDHLECILKQSFLLRPYFEYLHFGDITKYIPGMLLKKTVVQ